MAVFLKIPKNIRDPKESYPKATSVFDHNPKLSLYGSCNKECLSAAATLSDLEPDQKIKVFAASSHAHAYANSIKLSQIRNGREIKRLVDEPFYDRMYQEYKYLENPVEIDDLTDDLMGKV